MKIRYCVLLLLTFILTSCVTIYFDRPQPADAKDMKKVPSYLRGTWIEGFDTTVISKNTYYQTEWFIDTIPMSLFDTTSSLEIRNGLIYDLENDPFTGYAYEEMDDHLIIYVPDAFKFTLSDSAKLRKVSKNLFIFNAQKAHVWWEIFLIEKSSDGMINVRYPAESELDILHSMEAGREVIVELSDQQNSSLITNEFQKFWSVELNRDQMMDYIASGGFSDTVLVLDNSFKE